MSTSIAVIGNSDSIEYFRMLGCDTLETKEGELTDEQFQEIERKRYKIILVTEEVFHTYKKMIRARTKRMYPVVSIIPDVRGAAWTPAGPVAGTVAFEELREAVVRAIGQDISSV